MNIISKTQVVYNRSARRWEARNGSVESFPAGPEGKRAALLAALKADRLDLYRIVIDIAETHDHNPAVVDRLIKAAQLLVRGHVFENGRVKSQSGDDVYEVRFDGIPARYSCTCEDFERGLQRWAGLSKFGGSDSDYGLMCKHTWARLLDYLTGHKYAVDQPIPFRDRATALPASVDRGNIEDWV